jgi:hypothetical protein
MLLLNLLNLNFLNLNGCYLFFSFKANYRGGAEGEGKETTKIKTKEQPRQCLKKPKTYWGWA